MASMAMLTNNQRVSFSPNKRGTGGGHHEENSSLSTWDFGTSPLRIQGSPCSLGENMGFPW